MTTAKEAVQKLVASTRIESGIRANYSDDAIAHRLVQEHGHDWQYVAAWSRWLYWDGSRWSQDTTLKMSDVVRGVCREAALDAANERDGITAKEADRLASDLRNRAKHFSVENEAKSDRAVAATVDQWDADVCTLNTPAGEVNLRDGTLRPNQRRSHCSKITSVGPGGACPTWKTFLRRITGDDIEMIGYLARVAGYFLTGETVEHALFFLFGSGANGKSTFMNALTAMLGDYGQTAPMSMFTASPFDRHPTDLASLMGSRLVTASETEAGRSWNESQIKSLTGGDLISARFMYRDSFVFVPHFKLLFGGNHKPPLRNVDEAMRRRIHLIPFETTIPASERDPALTERLTAELGGILEWAIEGCLQWREIGLRPPEAVLNATADYLDDEDLLGTWLKERTAPNDDGRAGSTALFDDCRRWLDSRGEKHLSHKAFTQQLQERGYRAKRASAGTFFEGLELRQKAIDG